MNKHLNKILTFGIYGFALLLLGLVFYIGTKYNVPFEKITGDPVNYFQSHPFTGLISNLGILSWCIAAVVSLFSGIVLMRFKYQKESFFMVSSGIFTSVLLLDDFFLIHDFFLYLEGMTYLQYILYGIYAVALLYYAYKNYALILASQYVYLVVAIFCLGSSVFLDVLFEVFLDLEGDAQNDLQYFVEDSFKFLGIISWMVYFCKVSYTYLSERIVSKS